MSVDARITDADAIAASKTDPTRFGVIFDRHVEAIHAYLQRRVGPDIADDLAAETFVKAFGARGRYDVSRESARPWLFGIATNVVRHHRRRERRQLAAYRRSFVTPTLPDNEEVEDRADAAIASRRLARALASLRASQREVLVLHAWADLSYAEIAAALDLPIGTVRSRLHRARRRMRELIGTSGQVEGGVPSFKGA
jgi:RNA polymerase sigma factor (sigma-70 family)